MTDEKLITEAAKAIMEASHGEGAWELREPVEGDLYMRRARAAFAVFEKAHAPTPPAPELEGEGDAPSRIAPTADEREALIELAFKAREGAPTWQDDPEGRDAAIRWHMRGFNDALAVFAKGLNGYQSIGTPTDDERDALDQEAPPREFIGYTLHGRSGKGLRLRADMVTGQVFVDLEQLHAALAEESER